MMDGDENSALHKSHRGILPTSCLPVSYSYNRYDRYGEMVDRTHFWISIPDPEFVFELIKLDAQDPPKDMWGMALLKTASLEDGKVQDVHEELEFVFDLPYRPEMLEQLDQWFVRVKEAVKEAMKVE